MEVKLKKPINIETFQDGKPVSKEIKAIELNLDELTGSQVLAVDNELRSKGISGLDAMYSQEGSLLLAAKSSGMIPEDLKKLSAVDFLEVTANVTNFLLGWGSQKEGPLKNSETPS